MTQNAILAFSAVSMFNFCVGWISVLGPSSKIRLRTAQVFVISMTMSALYVCFQQNTDTQFRCAMIHFCTLTPIVVLWLVVLICYRHDSRREQIKKLEASLRSELERTSSELPAVK